jgi:hypothetical protein
VQRARGRGLLGGFLLLLFVCFGDLAKIYLVKQGEIEREPPTQRWEQKGFSLVFLMDSPRGQEGRSSNEGESTGDVVRSCKSS